MSDALVILLIDAAIFAAYFLGLVLLCAMRGVSAFRQYGAVFGRKTAIWFTAGLAASALVWTARGMGWLPTVISERPLACALLALAPLAFSARLFVAAWRKCPLMLRAGLLIAMITNGLVACAAAPILLIQKGLSRWPVKRKADKRMAAAPDGSAPSAVSTSQQEN